jgi:hypothetical protein
VRKKHEKTKEAIEKKGKYTIDRVNKKIKEVLFQLGDMVWVHFCKDRFPQQCKSKLQPGGASPYKVFAKINDNAYKIDLPTEEFGVGNSFNVSDLTPYDGEDLGALRSTPFERAEDDEDISSPLLFSPNDDDDVAIEDKSNEIRIGPMTRARAKLLGQHVNSLLIDYDILIADRFMLSKSMNLCMIRFINNPSIARAGVGELQREEQALISNIRKCVREEREAGALGGNDEINQT